MNHAPPLFVLALLTALAAVAPAQNCRYLPADAPAIGAPDPRPLGNGNAADPTYGDMRYQIQVPAAVLGNQAQQIVELFVAPAGSHTRTFTDLQVRMGHNPNGPLGAQMVFNMVGFTSRPVQYTQFSFDAQADQWVPLGMAFPFSYDPQFGDLVLEFFVRDAGVEAGGTGSTGLRTDPSIPFVWTSGQGYNGTLVAGGGIKVRLCTDHYGVVEYGFGGCTGSNGLRPSLSYAGSSQLGSTLQIRLDDAPAAPTSLAVLCYSELPRIGPLDLVLVGMPGCDAHVFGNVLVTRLISGGSHVESLAIPANLPPGVSFWNQWFVLDLPANQLGLTASNVGRFLCGATP